MRDINVGDRVVALKDGDRCPQGLPLVVPLKGEHYTITSIYEMPYGLGCTLEGMNHAPYRGYFLYRDGEWYFEKVNPLATDVQAWIGTELPPELEDIEIPDEEEVTC